MSEGEDCAARRHEAQVLGAVLTDPGLIDEVAEIITGGDFYEHRHELIWSAITALHETGQPVDPLSVADSLNRSGDLRRAGGHPGIHSLIQENVIAASAAWHARRVRDASTLRELGKVSASIGQLAAGESATEEEAFAAVDAARAMLDQFVDRDTDEVDHASAVWASLDALNDPAGDPTPWPEVTRAMAGWKPGLLYLIGARPATGKSIAGVMAAVGMARLGKQALLFSMEMTRTELYHRMLVAAAEVPMDRLQGRRLTENDHARLRRAAADIAALPLVVDDRASLGVAHIRAKVRAAQRKGAVGIVVIDYLGLVRPPEGTRRQDRRVQVDAVAQALKELAMELRVPVVAMAQVNRGPEARADKMPTAADLREAGGQEQAADVVMLLHRDPRDDQMGSTLHMFMAKNRHGGQAMFEFVWQGHYARFQSFEDAQ